MSPRQTLEKGEVDVRTWHSTPDSDQGSMGGTGQAQPNGERERKATVLDARGDAVRWNKAARVGFGLVCAIILSTLAASAADQCPKGCIDATPPTCKERLARFQKAGCPAPTEIKIVEHATTVPAVCPECPTTVVPGPERVVYKEAEARRHYRGAFGGDLGYDATHKPLFGLHGGFLAPTDKHGGNLFWKIGPTYQERDNFDATCRIGCKTCGAHGDAAGPWGALTSLSFIWK